MNAGRSDQCLNRCTHRGKLGHRVQALSTLCPCPKPSLVQRSEQYRDPVIGAELIHTLPNPNRATHGGRGRTLEYLIMGQ